MNNWLIFAMVAIPSVILHEVAHGYIADVLGDHSAREAGRLTLNPIKHVDPVGTILLPALLIFSNFPVFGYAKPVPVNVTRLRHRRRDSVLVSLAGPATNFLLCGTGWLVTEYAFRVYFRHTTILINSLGSTGILGWHYIVLQIGLGLGTINLMLGVFNLMPIPPLDGSALIEYFVPPTKLGGYFRFRAKALPVLFGLLLIDSFNWHLTNHLLQAVQNAWLATL
ncbi:MAG: site-2 protease family protein [Actinomycetota bacterium]|jgi:hypothetical protein